MMAVRLLGLDVGEVRTGLAVSDELGITARPLKTVPTEKLAEELQRVLAEQEIRTVVVGRPRHLDGRLGEQARDITATIESIRAGVAAAFIYEDETGTTVAAKDHGGSDAEAARVMLQGYLDEHA